MAMIDEFLMAVKDFSLETSRFQWGSWSKRGMSPTQKSQNQLLWHLVRVTGTFAVAVDEVSGDDAGAKDSEAHEKSDTGMHAYVDSFMDLDTLLSICQEDGGAKEKDS